MDQPPQTPDPRGPRRPSPAIVALVLSGIVLALSVGAYALVTAWLG
jgi:multisubunit Na+/H+ antiporter MnhC subunit